MLVAIIFVHAGHGLLAMNGGWEYPLTLLAVSLFFIVHGAGPLSIDAMITHLREARQEKVLAKQPAGRPGEPHYPSPRGSAA
jgi:hypothetical protein